MLDANVISIQEEKVRRMSNIEKIDYNFKVYRACIIEQSNEMDRLRHDVKTLQAKLVTHNKLISILINAGIAISITASFALIYSIVK